MHLSDIICVRKHKMPVEFDRGDVTLTMRRQPDGTTTYVPDKYATMRQYEEREEDKRMYAWYCLTEQEFNALSADAQHRLIDRYHETQNLLTDRDVEKAIATIKAVDVPDALKRMFKWGERPVLAKTMQRVVNNYPFEGAYLDPTEMFIEHARTYGLQMQRYWLDGRRRPNNAPDYLPDLVNY